MLLRMPRCWTVALRVSRGESRQSAPAWKVGDCYATADVDGDSVELTSKVDCTREHAVQIVAGRALPKDLAGAGLDPLLERSTPQRTELLTLVRDTCTPAATAKSLYPPKTAKRLAALFAKHDVAEWMAPAAGMMGWVLPDADSFDAYIQRTLGSR